MPAAWTPSRAPLPSAGLQRGPGKRAGRGQPPLQDPSPAAQRVGRSVPRSHARGRRARPMPPGLCHLTDGLACGHRPAPPRCLRAFPTHARVHAHRLIPARLQLFRPERLPARFPSSLPHVRVGSPTATSPCWLRPLTSERRPNPAPGWQPAPRSPSSPGTETLPAARSPGEPGHTAGSRHGPRLRTNLHGCMV